MNKDDAYRLSISIPRRIVKVTLIVILSALLLWIAINTFRYFIMDISYLRSSSANISDIEVNNCIGILNDKGFSTKVVEEGRIADGKTIFIKYRQAKDVLNANLQFNDQWDILFTEFDPIKAYWELFGFTIQ